MPISERLQIAKNQIISAREYVLTLLDGLTEDQWFWTSEPPLSHIAWQVGHLAMAQYGLCLFRQRGRQFEDAELMSSKFRKNFMKGTTPSNDRSTHPKPPEIMDVLEKVYQQVHAEIDGFDGPGLDDEIEMPYAHYPTKYGSLLFAAHHEMLHAGQIGMLRRLQGLEPIR